MAAVTRKQISQAFWAIFTPLVVTAGSQPSASQPFASASRRLELPESVPAHLKPALFLSSHNEKWNQQDNSNPGIVVLNYSLWIMTNVAKDQTLIPMDYLDDLIDAVSNALGLAENKVYGTIQLAGIVVNCYIDGDVLKVDGALDGNGLAMIPIKILVPSF